MKRCLCQAVIDERLEREELCKRIAELGITPTTCGRMVQAEATGTDESMMLIGLFEHFTWHSVYAEF